MAPRSQIGATLIELMVAFVVLGILITAGIPSFRDWLINSQVRTATDAINDGLQLARAEAVKRNAPVRLSLPDPTRTGWLIETLDRTTGAWTSLQRRNAGEGTGSVLVAASQATVTFVGSGGVMPLPAQPITIDVSHPAGGSCQTVSGGGEVRCLRVTVAPPGQVRMCDPAAQPTNPTAC
jgi:type IV fimbrial biogenesis protein FimT